MRFHVEYLSSFPGAAPAVAVESQVAQLRKLFPVAVNHRPDSEIWLAFPPPHGFKIETAANFGGEIIIIMVMRMMTIITSR